MKKSVHKIQLEKRTQEFLDAVAASNSPQFYTLTPQEARAIIDKMQLDDQISLPPAKIEEKTIPGTNVSIQIIRPETSHGKLPVMLYFHGGGWVLGSIAMYDRMLRDIAIGANAAVVFVNFSRSPEAKYPVAIEECYATLKYVGEHGAAWDLDPSRLSVAGDSSGGTLAIAISLLAKERRGPKIGFQLLLYPVTDCGMDTLSYQQFSQYPLLTKSLMEWFWNAYQPNLEARKHYLLSPLRAPVEMLKGLPPALVITAEVDVIRDEGEEYAYKLMEAGVPTTSIRFLGTIHSFMMFNKLSQTPAAKSAIAIACDHLRKMRSV